MSGQVVKQLPLETFMSLLAKKVPTPGGGGAAAVAASLGQASGAMACIYTTRKKDEESGVAEEAKGLAEKLTQASMACLDVAQEDAEAYADLQKTWKKDCPYSPEEVQQVKQRALNVPVNLVRTCHNCAELVHNFIPKCNSGIVSDAKVALHLLSGAAKAAYQTVLVNQPPDEVKTEMKQLLEKISDYENQIL